MTLLAVLANGAMGVAYMVIGGLVVIDQARGFRRHGLSPIGLALVALAYTCGPHHLDHALHLLHDRSAAPLDLLTVAVGLPPGAAFAALRVEAFTGGAGDRNVDGTPAWLALVPPLLALEVAVIFAGTSFTGDSLALRSDAVPNIVLVALYVAIAAVLTTTQLRVRSATGSWSVSGLSLAGIFATCAPMHAVVAFYTGTERYARDVHGLTIDWLAVPAGIFFLWVAWRLNTGELRDWNRPQPAAAGAP